MGQLAATTDLDLDTEMGAVTNMTIFGRQFSAEERYMFGCVQLASIFLSLASLFFSVLHFNSLEARRLSVRGAGKLLLGLGYFAATIVFRALGLALALCFLGWWAATLIFLLFFTTVLTALCIGDNILRACVYGFWSFLVPVGYARDPTEPLDYNILYTKDPDKSKQAEAEGEQEEVEKEFNNKEEVLKRAFEDQFN